ncbi:MAG TPA: prenyltransferase/squalene oxidase repeat-containing protein [Solirubrobacterales bacterium]|nr:prenyltransferase/squalene oxidase repeat-containing protein [Solirubrobacterales bacterium]
MGRLLAIALVASLALAAAAAAAPTAVNQGRLDGTVRFLQEAQNPDGGFGGDRGGESVQAFSAWAALALAAAGINPQDQRKPGGSDVYSFLAGHFQQGVEDETCMPQACTTALERELMVANASCTGPHAFGPVDLVAQLLPRQAADGSFPFVPGGVAQVNATVFAVLALAPVAEPEAQAAIGPAAEWIEAAQEGSGGWSWESRESPDEVDMTGAAIQALVAAGRRDSPAVANGLAYLRGAQNADGGFPALPGEPESNVASTAWATQAIWAAGENPETWRTGGGPTEEPLDYLASLQEPDGHLRWRRGQDLNGIWMTAYAAPAFAGQVWPIPCPPRAQPVQAQPQPGEGGGIQSGSGVIAGGGGGGAPLFSRPKPQSKGRTPGGARLLHDEGRDPVDHGAIRRGGNAKQAAGSERAEASRGREVTGTLIGSGAPRDGRLAFAAPGLHGAGSDEGSDLLAAVLGALALLAALAGAGRERRRQEALA